MILDKRRKDVLGVILILSSIAVVSAGGFFYYDLSKEKYDPITLCPELPEQQRISIVVDRTDPFNDQSRVRARVLSARDDLDIYGRLVIFVIDEDGVAPRNPIFDLCNPGRGKDVSPLYRNPKRVEEKFQREFSGPLEGLLAELVVPGIAPSSPVTQTLVNALAFDTLSNNPSVHRLVLISDLLENSELFDSYSERPNLNSDIFESLVSEKYGSSSILGDVSVLFDVIWRRNMYRRQQRLLVDYWDAGLRQIGVSVFHTIPSEEN